MIRSPQALFTIAVSVFALVSSVVDGRSFTVQPSLSVSLKVSESPVLLGLTSLPITSDPTQFSPAMPYDTIPNDSPANGQVRISFPFDMCSSSSWSTSFCNLCTGSSFDARAVLADVARFDVNQTNKDKQTNVQVGSILTCASLWGERACAAHVSSVSQLALTSSGKYNDTGASSNPVSIHVTIPRLCSCAQCSNYTGVPSKFAIKSALLARDQKTVTFTFTQPVAIENDQVLASDVFTTGPFLASLGSDATVTWVSESSFVLSVGTENDVVAMMTSKLAFRDGVIELKFYRDSQGKSAAITTPPTSFHIRLAPENHTIADSTGTNQYLTGSDDGHASTSLSESQKLGIGLGLGLGVGLILLALLGWFIYSRYKRSETIAQKVALPLKPLSPATRNSRIITTPARKPAIVYHTNEGTNGQGERENTPSVASPSGNDSILRESSIANAYRVPDSVRIHI